jgi:putative solute:sodium symporter small subunit
MNTIIIIIRGNFLVLLGRHVFFRPKRIVGKCFTWRGETHFLEDAVMSSQSTGAPSHWDRTKSLLFKTLAIWVFLAFIIHWFGDALNGAAGSFPGGYFMAGMGVQISFAVLVFWFVTKQSQLDDEFGVSED